MIIFENQDHRSEGEFENQTKQKQKMNIISLKFFDYFELMGVLRCLFMINQQIKLLKYRESTIF